MALSDLVKSCQEYFVDQSINIPIAMGERPVFKQSPGSNKIVFVPIGGKYGPPRGINYNPRHLRTWISTADVHVWGYDGYGASKGFSGQDELLHYERTEILHNQICRAIHHYAYGMRYDLSNPRWTNTPTDKKFGKELVFTVELEVPIIDVPATIAYPDPDSPLIMDGYMQFNQGYIYNDPPLPAFIGDHDLDGYSTINNSTDFNLHLQI